MCFEADLPLKVHRGRRLKALRRLFLLLAKEFLDSMAHTVGFSCGLGFGLDPKPGFPAWGIANVSHASLPQFLRRTGIAYHPRQLYHYRLSATCRQGQAHKHAP